ncbi:MAG TPA: N,N-dimethylformamidase beta subunit family domain-containing protein, partial [Candidatus Angelobacter sp.]
MRRRFLGFLALVFVLTFCSTSLFASCSSPANAIERENCLPGNPSSQWDITNAGDPSIQGFATDISVNVGGTIVFKINTNATRYHFDIYRLGYYNGNGARLIAQNLTPSAHLPQTQPACLTDSTTRLLDCGNWAVSASWAVPSTAVSGVYLAHLIREDTGGDSHIVFVVRNDASHSDVLFQTSDESWQAYNDFGGASLYGPDGEFDLSLRAFKVSYNRPFNTRAFENASWLFYAEFPMIKWLEANGYDVTYFTSVDAARNGALITNHKLYISTGHDEYASGPKRANIEAARNAGVNLAFFSGNEFFWKTRWENSIDGSGTPFRTMVCYKETLANAKIDPNAAWTGTWRDPRFSPPADGGSPENALTGQLFRVNGFGADNNALSIQIPAADGKMRFWRNTPVASQSAGQVWTLAGGTLGYEWDVDEDNTARPAGNIRLSSATYPLVTDYLLDFGGFYGAGTAAHHMTLYRAPSGALVFGAGTVQWSWGLDTDHDTLYYPGFPADPVIQQATLNLFADMGVQPATIQPGLLPATQSTDVTPPHSAITTPANGASVPAGTTVTVTGTAGDLGGGVVGGVEVSADGGATWHPANGRENWSFPWHPQFAGTANLRSRAVDDNGNLEVPTAGISVLAAAHDCPCTIWSTSTVPATIDSADINSGEFGVRFFAGYDGYITGIRFYKASTNNGTHIGHLWSNTGALLASATFSGETASGWQQVSFSNPVPVTANTVYVASYFSSSGHYSVDAGYFGSGGVDNSPLHATANGISGANGVFSYGSTTVFPTSTFGAANYWADVVYLPGSSMPGAPASLLANPSILNFASFLNQPAPASQTVNIFNQGTGTLNWTATKSASWITLSATSGSTPASLAVSVNTTGLAAGNYSGTITITPSGGATGPQTINVSMTLTALLLSSNFDNGNMEGWVNSPLGLASNWSVVNGALQYNGGGHTQVYAGDSSWTDYSLQADIKLATASDYPGGIRGRVNPSTGAAYALWLYPAEGVIKLFKNVAWNIDSGFTLLGQASAGLTPGSFHHVQMNFQGSQIQVFFDGSLAITATDITNPSGMIALDTSNQLITFDNVQVTALAATANPLVPTPSSLTFNGNFQAASPAPQTVQLGGTTSGILAWTAVSTAPWLSVTPGSGTTPVTLQVSANTSGLAGGTYTGSIRVTSLAAPNSPLNISVTLNVIVPPPAIVLSPASMSFQALTGQASPPAQTLQILNGGTGSFSWTASSNASWLTISGASGATPATINVSANSAGLAAGVYTGSITVSATGIANSPQTLPVTLSVLTQDMADTFTDLAQGWISTPLGNAGGWSVSNGVYSYSGTGLSLSCAGNTAWTDYDFDTNIKLSTLNNWPGGVRGRVNPSTGAGYAVWLYPGSGLAILYRVSQWNINDPALTALAVANLSYNTTAFHDLKMSFRGSQISVFWDGTPLMSATDATYASGFVCMDADNQPISYSNVRVASSQNAVTIDTPSPSSLVFAALPGTQPAAQTLNITAGGASTTWSVTTNQPWLQATASTNKTPGTITVSASTTGLAAGTYTGSVTIHAPGATNSPLVIPVTLGVKTAILSTGPSPLNFFGATGFTTPSQNINVTNAGSGALNWTASADASWITLSATSGTAPA